LTAHGINLAACARCSIIQASLTSAYVQKFHLTTCGTHEALIQRKVKTDRLVNRAGLRSFLDLLDYPVNSSFEFLESLRIKEQFYL